MPKAEELAKKALEIDNMLGRAHGVLGFNQIQLLLGLGGSRKRVQASPSNSTKVILLRI